MLPNEVDILIFLSTPSARRATASSCKLLPYFIISIHALREEGDPHSIGAKAKINNISIHALREEGDAGGVADLIERVISIHALREEGDEV